MENKDYMGRVLVVLVLTLIGCFALYGLPDELWGHKIKKVDLLSDIRVSSNPRKAALDSIKQVLSLPDTLQIDTVALRTSVVEATGIDSASLQLRDSLYNRLYAATDVDSTGSRIQDYSPGHVGLKRFFKTLNERKKIGRPVRVAFMGDSFIEGDIMVSDFRSVMQKQFGGRGVGFVPVTSVAAQFRPTVNQKASGWKTWSMIHDQSQDYVLPGMLFEAEKEEATIQLKNTNRHPELTEVETVKLLYMANRNTRMTLALNATDTISRVLAPTDQIAQNISEGIITEASFTFTQTEGFKALGVALEDKSGVVVDNFSLRGNSGMILERFDKERCRQWSAVRPYDLLILQYGLNVISEDMLDYGWYRARMIEVVRHLQECFPDTDILLLGVTDRSHLENGRYETMPEVLAMLHTQQQIARRAGIPFWNMFAAMGGENSMVRYVENNWASKDYTHFSFRGGRELAHALMKALLIEKEFYDEAEKTLH